MNATRIWAFGTVLAIVAVIALGYLLGVKPMLDRLESAKSELAATEANNAAQSATLALMKAQFDDIESLRDELEVLRISVPGAIDSDFVYALFSAYATSAGAKIDSITTGEAQPYGVTSDGAPTTEGVTPIANLYTIPVTVAIRGNKAGPAMSFVAAMQRGPRLFLVTGLAAGEDTGDEDPITTITGYMFVLADPDADPSEAALALAEHPVPAGQFSKPLGTTVSPTPLPTPSGTPTPDPSGSATPTPDPTETSGP